MVLKAGGSGSRRSGEECGRGWGRDSGDLERGRDSGNGETYLGLRTAEVMSNRACYADTDADTDELFTSGSEVWSPEAGRGTG